MKKLILLHGALGSASMFHDLATVLQPEHEIHTFDFSGHAKRPFSEEGFGIEVFAEELKAYIIKHQLHGATVFGYSMGGYVALYLASKQSDLMGKIITLGTKFQWDPESAEAEVEKLNPDVIKEKVPAFASTLADIHGKKEWKKLIWQTAGMMMELGDEPLLTTEILSSIANPVTILLGDEDNMVSQGESEKSAQILPNASFQLLQNTPHPLEKVRLDLLAELLR